MHKVLFYYNCIEEIYLNIVCILGDRHSTI